jgi:S1-C subfamily serine protease
MNEAPAPDPKTRTRALLRRLRGWVRKSLPFIAGIAVTFAAFSLYDLATPPPRPITQQDVDTAIANAIASVTPRPAYSAQVYQVIQPSLVLIETRNRASGNSTSGERSLGTGVIINDRGDILTSLHVVRNASTIDLTFADGTKARGRIALRQAENDVALLRANKLPAQVIPATMGNPGALRVGDEAYVVGHPFGLYSSMSTGVISGLNRSFKRSDTDESLENLIQIDAAVNPGNSGGPLLNRNGEVVGIVAALLNPTEQEVFIGIGFAVTITAAGGAIGAPPL